MAEANQEDGAVDRGCQRDKIKELIDQPLNNGDAWCLLDLRWFAQWKLYVGWDEFDSSCAGEPTSHPGPVDNSALLQENQIDLKEHLSDVTDYVLVPKAACEMLVTCYGIAEGQEIISREVIDQGILASYLVVEIYLTELRLALFPDVEQVTVKKFSKADSLENVEKLMRTVYAVPANRPVRLWSRSSTQVYEELSDKKQSIQENSLSGNQTIVMEVQSETGTWPRRTVQYSKRTLPGSSLVPYSSSYADGAGSASSSRLAQPGICGLNNLGNTCFMNSVLQCMSNTPPIVRYFLEDHHWSELNKDNPLGNHGEIAKAFAELLKAMWSGQHQAFAPRAFKLQVGRFAPQFSGYQQHDSQELLTFLLDGLHEDLNRIVKKPYVEMKDADGRSDEKVAQEAWQNYRKRNDSMIVDLFHGLLKSTLVCPECSKVSVTFDPTCYLSLPLPVKKERNIDVYLVPLAGRVKRYRVVVPKLGNISDLTDALTKLCAIPGERLVVCDVHQHRFHRVFTSDNTVSHINERDVIYVYELADKIGASGTCCLNVYLKEARTKTNYGCGNLFGVPFIMQVPREGLSYDQLYEAILSRLMQRHIKTPIIEAADADDAAAATDMEVEHVGSDSDNGNEMAADENQQQPQQQQQRRSSTNKRTATKHLFTVEMSNTSGTSNGSLKCDNRSVTLNAKSCVTCEWMPAVKEAYFDADADDDVDEDASFQHRPVAKKHVLQLRECLELFTSVERLGAEDAWYCPVCKEHKRATKKFDLWSLPEVLVIHLKRFSYTRSLRDKLDTLVEFPTHGLDMTPYVINPNHPPAVYDLIGVCNHYGGLGGGHYTAYAKNKDDGRWYCFDDSSVSEAQEDAVCSKAAYVLFYIRRNGSKQWLDNIKPRKSKPSPAPVRKCVVKEASNGSEEDEDGQDMDSS